MPKELDKLNDQTKKKYKTAVGDVKVVHDKVRDYLSGVAKEGLTGNSVAKTEVAAANAALQARLAAQTSQVRGDANSELGRLGLGSVGLGNFNNDSKHVGNLAKVAGKYEYDNLNQERVNSKYMNTLYRHLNKDQREGAFQDQEDLRDEGFKQNRLTYENMLAYAKQNSFTPYGSGGGGGAAFTPYVNPGVPPLAATPKKPVAKKPAKGLLNSVLNPVDAIFKQLIAQKKKQQAKELNNFFTNW